MRLRTFLAVSNLARKAISTANRDPEDIAEVLTLINPIAHEQCGQFFADRIGGPVNEGFSVKGRGYDAEPLPGYPTCWIWFPNGYRIKVGLDSKCSDILGEDRSHMPV